MRSGIGLKVLGLYVLAISVMAIGASAAQASEWMVNKQNLGSFSPALEPTLTTTLQIGTSISLLTTVNKLAIKVTCTSWGPQALKLKAPETTTNGKIVFDNCEIFKDADGKLMACTRVSSVGAANKTIETAELHGLLVSHTGGEPVVSVLPNNAEKRFTTIETAGCGLPELIPVFGELTLKDSKGDGNVELATHEVEQQETLSHLFAISDTEEHRAKLIGKTELVLTGTSHKEFSGLP